MESMAATGLTVENSTTCNMTLSELILVKIDLLLHHAVERVCSICRSALGVHTRLVHHVLHRLLRLSEIHVATTVVIFMGPRSLSWLHGLVLGRFPEG
jgi:ABC-type antimicrobial peptide transport system permease subunit